jgi:hypothetical protein
MVTWKGKQSRDIGDSSSVVSKDSSLLGNDTMSFDIAGRLEVTAILRNVGYHSHNDTA